jgi:hypothetical protein
MDSKLDRYLDQQDSVYATYLEDQSEGTIEDERTYLATEIRYIEKLLSSEDADTGFVTPTEWHGRLNECKTRLRNLLTAEQTTIQGTIDLHCAGLIKCNTRYLEIEAELKQLEPVRMAVAS